MAVEGNKDRSASVGHHLDGEMVTYTDGTQGFRQRIGVYAQGNDLETDDVDIVKLLSAILHEQRQTNKLLDFIAGGPLLDGDHTSDKEF